MQTADQYQPLHDTILTTKKLLESFTSADKLSSNKCDSLIIQFANLSKTLKQSDITELPHEFYEEISSLVRVMTELRRKAAFKTGDNAAQVVNAFDTLTILIRNMLYQLPLLAAEKNTFPLDELRTLLAQTADIDLIAKIKALMPLSDLAMKHSDNCAKAADEATEKATKMLNELQQAYDKGKAPGLALQQAALQQSLAMYVANTTATLAVDETTAVSMAFDKILQQAEAQLKK